MAKVSPVRKAGHRIGTRLPPAFAKRWQSLLAGEGGTQQYHCLAALTLYCETMGYGPKPLATK